MSAFRCGQTIDESAGLKDSYTLRVSLDGRSEIVLFDAANADDAVTAAIAEVRERGWTETDSPWEGGNVVLVAPDGSTIAWMGARW